MTVAPPTGRTLLRLEVRPIDAGGLAAARALGHMAFRRGGPGGSSSAPPA